MRQEIEDAKNRNVTMLIKIQSYEKLKKLKMLRDKEEEGDGQFGDQKNDCFASNNQNSFIQYNHNMQKNSEIRLQDCSKLCSKKQYQNIIQDFRQQPDLYLILKQKIYPSHRTLMAQSLYISSQLHFAQRVLVIPFEIDVQAFQQALNYLYGGNLSIESEEQIERLLKVANTLKIKKFEEEIIAKIKAQFDDFSIFNLYRIGSQLQIDQLVNECVEGLINFQFQQLNINRYHLFQLNPQFFSQIIKVHQKLAGNKTIRGLKKKNIEQIIQEFIQLKKCSLDVNELMKIGYDCFQSRTVGVLRKPSKIKRLSTLAEKKSRSQPLKKTLQVNVIRGIQISGNDQSIKKVLDFSVMQLMKGNEKLMKNLNRLNMSQNKQDHIVNSIQKLIEEKLDDLQNKIEETSKCISKFTESDELCDKQHIGSLQQIRSEGDKMSQFKTKSALNEQQNEVSSCTQFVHIRIPKMQKNISF